MDELATVINGWLQKTVVRCTGSAGFGTTWTWQSSGTARMWMQILSSSRPSADCSRAGCWCRSEDIGENSARLEQRTQRFFDEETGEAVSTPVEMPVWVEAKAEGGTPTCSALYKTYEIVEHWIREHPQSLPPVIIHFTDGESQEGDPRPYAEAGAQLETEVGRVLLFNCHIGIKRDQPVVFPDRAESLSRRFLAECCSTCRASCPMSYVTKLAPRLPGRTGCGLICNADPVHLIKFLQFVTGGVTLFF